MDWLDIAPVPGAAEVVFRARGKLRRGAEFEPPGPDVAVVDLDIGEDGTVVMAFTIARPEALEAFARRAPLFVPPQRPLYDESLLGPVRPDTYNLLTPTLTPAGDRVDVLVPDESLAAYVRDTLGVEDATVRFRVRVTASSSWRRVGPGRYAFSGPWMTFRFITVHAAGVFDLFGDNTLVLGGIVGGVRHDLQVAYGNDDANRLGGMATGRCPQNGLAAAGMYKVLTLRCRNGGPGTIKVTVQGTRIASACCFESGHVLTDWFISI